MTDLERVRDQLLTMVGWQKEAAIIDAHLKEDAKRAMVESRLLTERTQERNAALTELTELREAERSLAQLKVLQAPEAELARLREENERLRELHLRNVRELSKVINRAKTAISEVEEEKP